MSTNQDKTTQALIDYAKHVLKNQDGKPERAGFKRFKQTDVYAALDPETAEQVYETITGDTPYCTGNVGAAYLPENRNVIINHVRECAESLGEMPTSVHDLAGNFERLTSNSSYWQATDETFLREFFYHAARYGIVKEIEIKTCGRVAIRLYYI